MLDVNSGVVYESNPNPDETEPPLMTRMIELVQGLVDVPLCIDSSVPGALEAGLAACEAGSESSEVYLTKFLSGDSVVYSILIFETAGAPSSAPEFRPEQSERALVRAAKFILNN